MLRFIAGILACIIAQAVGLDTITAGLEKANKAARIAYDTAAATVAAERGHK